MSIFSGINTSASALTAQRTRADIIAENLANAQTTRTKNGLPYRRKVTVFQERQDDNSLFSTILEKRNIKEKYSAGVEVVGVIEDKSPFNMKYDPGHPDADENGYVMTSNVDPIKEMVDMISAQRSYEANVTAINTSKAILNKALEIGK